MASLPALSHWIDGQPVAGSSGRFADVFDPSTGEVSAGVPLASTQELERCISVARSAFKDWAATPPLRRARVMFRFRQLLDNASDELAKLISREHGKTVSDARGEVIRGLEVVEFA